MGATGTLIAMAIGLVVLIVVGAAAQPVFLLPIACFAVGVYFWTQDRLGLGWLMMVVTFIAFCIAVNVVASGSPTG